jgi:tetratricopeptide (TPR) repeat protein
LKKIFIIILIILSVSCCTAYADYSQNMQKGKEAFTAGNYAESLKYYKEAFNENPNEQLGSFIVRLEKKAGEQAVQKLPLYRFEQDKPGPGIYPASVAAVITDLVLVGTAAYAYFDYNNSVDNYNELYAEIDNTNTVNYNRLLGEVDKLKSKEGFMAVFGSLAGAAVLYTLADVFFIHYAFPLNVSAGLNPQSRGVAFTVAKEF